MIVVSTPMNQAIKPLWVKRLRSGLYPQCIGWLSAGEGDQRRWDPWGILSDLAADAGIIPAPTVWNTTSDGVLWSYPPFGGAYANTSYPAEAVLIWAKVAVDVRLVIDGHPATILSHNDRGATFEQIAAAIEAQL